MKVHPSDPAIQALTKINPIVSKLLVVPWVRDGCHMPDGEILEPNIVNLVAKFVNPRFPLKSDIERELSVERDRISGLLCDLCPKSLHDFLRCVTGRFLTKQVKLHCANDVIFHNNANAVPNLEVLCRLQRQHIVSRQLSSCNCACLPSSGICNGVAFERNESLTKSEALARIGSTCLAGSHTWPWHTIICIKQCLARCNNRFLRPVATDDNGLSELDGLHDLVCPSGDAQYPSWRRFVDGCLQLTSDI
mmetsp:Transcript_52920/g.94391  ORF Transcript_52920/g.94391 Transcript_52920/m.94391 type:complete len:249 (+) Transcript_52920:999-1745(+)